MTNLIARLFPYQDDKYKYVEQVIQDAKGTARFVPRQVEPQPPGRWSRETTAALEEDDSSKNKKTKNMKTKKKEEEEEEQEEEKKKKKKSDNLDQMDSIQLKYDDPTFKNGKGIMFGRNPDTCDIVLPTLLGISQEHCYFTYDSKRRLILVDKSTNGTIVTYNSQGRIKKKNFTWILGGDEFVDDIEVIVIEIHEFVKFQIVVAKHDATPYAYQDNVDRFLAQMEELASFPLARLALKSRTNTLQIGTPIESNPSPPSGRGIPPPTSNSILLHRRVLGKGSYGRVVHVWDVSTGAEYASKKFFNPKIFDWKGEVDRMKALSHPNIVELINAFEAEIIMEYVPMGNLTTQCDMSHFSESELEQVLIQLLTAVNYLHEQPFVHRDIKPDNVLVQSRDPLLVKLSDFGLSKASNSLHTFCGTTLYAAPELYTLHEPDGAESYTAAVDIWALGATILEFGYGLPRYPKKDLHSVWCKKLIRSLDVWDPDGFTVLYKMLVLDPKGRASARACLQHVLEDRARRPTWTAINAHQRFDPSSYNSQDEATLPLDYAANGLLAPRVPDVDDSTVQPPSHATGSIDLPNSQLDTFRPRRSSRSGAPTIVQEQIWSWPSLPATSRDANSIIYETEEEAHTEPHSSRPEARTAVQKRGRSSQSNPSAKTSDKHRPSQRRRKTSAARSSGSGYSECPESVLNLFGDDWLNDPNCVGSSVAAMGQSESSWGSSTRSSHTRPLNENFDANASACCDINTNSDFVGATPSEENFMHVLAQAVRG